MKSSIFEIFSETEMAIAAKNLLEFYPDTKIFLLNGNLGAGKTTFVKYICQHLGCCLLYTSPSPRDRTRSRMPSSA